MRPAIRAGARIARPVLAASRRVRQPHLTVLGWHRIDDDPGSLSTAPATFTAQLDLLEQWQAAVLPLPEALRRQAAGDLPDRAVVLTFDDGYASVLERAWPELHARGMAATVYAVSGYLDGRRRFPWDSCAGDADHCRLADRAALLEAADAGLDIGSHTVTHRWLPRLGAKDVLHEMVTSRTELEDQLGRSITSLAYPMGGWNSSVRAAAAKAGYDNAITVDRGPNLGGHHRLSLRRSFAPNSVTDFRLVLEGAYDWLRPVDRWRTRRGPAS